jgi:hypothetical protein
MITAERLRELVNYNSDTGVFTHVRRRGVKAGAVAGCLRGPGDYRVMQAGGRQYLAHRLAWLYVTGSWPAAEIDHINGDKADNRFANLREATSSQNKWNAGASSRNKLGLKGVAFHKKSGRWRAIIGKDNKSITIGYFATPGEAHAAYCTAAERLHGDFARTA